MTTVVTIQQGGTSANSAAGALTALGAVNRAGDTMTGLLNVANATSIVTTGNVGFGTATPSSRLHIVGTTIIEEILEKANVFSSAVGANTNYDVLDCAVQYYTANATSNTTLNIRGNSTVTLNSVMSVNQSLTLSFIMTNGATAYRVANIQLDAVNTAIRWSGGSAPTACSNSAEAYAVTVVKTGTAAVYNIFASKTQFA